MFLITLADMIMKYICNYDINCLHFFTIRCFQNLKSKKMFSKSTVEKMFNFTRVAWDVT